MALTARPGRSLTRERRQNVLARLFASSTDLGADAAVLVVARVPLTFIAASSTSLDASPNSSARELGHELGLPGEDASGRDTDVTAVVTQRNARDHRLDIGLAEVSVGTGRAALSTLEARVDAGDQGVEFHPECPRMRLQNLPSVGHVPPFTGGSTGRVRSTMWIVVARDESPHMHTGRCRCPLTLPLG